MKIAYAEVTLYRHEGWVGDEVGLPLVLSLGIDEASVPCRIDSEHHQSVELGRAFDAMVALDLGDGWGAVDLRGRLLPLHYGEQVLGHVRMLSSPS